MSNSVNTIGHVEEGISKTQKDVSQKPQYAVHSKESQQETSATVHRRPVIVLHFFRNLFQPLLAGMQGIKHAGNCLAFENPRNRQKTHNKEAQSHHAQMRVSECRDWHSVNIEWHSISSGRNNTCNRGHN